MGQGFCHSLIWALEAPVPKTQPLLTCVLLLWRNLPHSFHFSAFSTFPLMSKVLHLRPPTPTITFNHFCFPSPVLILSCPHCMYA